MNEGFWQALRTRGIDPQEVIERFVRASGNGGQNVNKVSTAVQLDVPRLKLGVVCADERSQHQNRVRAWEQLIKKWDARVAEKRAQKVAAREKIRRQKRKRPRGLQEKILKSKKHRSEVKKGRKGNWD